MFMYRACTCVCVCLSCRRLRSSGRRGRTSRSSTATRRQWGRCCESSAASRPPSTRRSTSCPRKCWPRRRRVMARKMLTQQVRAGVGCACVCVCMCVVACVAYDARRLLHSSFSGDVRICWLFCLHQASQRLKHQLVNALEMNQHSYMYNAVSSS